MGKLNYRASKYPGMQALDQVCFEVNPDITFAS